MANPVSVGTAVINNVVGSQSSHPQYITTIGQVSYFTADDGIHGRELWRTDGTLAGTSLVKDINPGADSSSLGYLTQLNGVLYFDANDGVTRLRAVAE